MAVESFIIVKGFAGISGSKTVSKCPIRNSFFPLLVFVLLAAFSELLLDQGRYQEVVFLLRKATQNDVLLFRLALAEKAINHPLAEAHEALLGARFAASRLRGDKLHLQDEARFVLVFQGRPKESLGLALENWALKQREAGDARIVLEAALAAHDIEGARSVLDWLDQTRCEDKVLRRLAQMLRSPGK